MWSLFTAKEGEADEYLGGWHFLRRMPKVEAGQATRGEVHRAEIDNGRRNLSNSLTFMHWTLRIGE